MDELDLNMYQRESRPNQPSFAIDNTQQGKNLKIAPLILNQDAVQNGNNLPGIPPNPGPGNTTNVGFNTDSNPSPDTSGTQELQQDTVLRSGNRMKKGIEIAEFPNLLQNQQQIKPRNPS